MSLSPVIFRRLTQARQFPSALLNLICLPLFLTTSFIVAAPDHLPTSGNMIAAETASPRSSDAKAQISRQQLFEAVSGYQEVFGRKRDPAGKTATGNEPWRFSGPKSLPSENSDRLRTLEVHKKLASKRVDRQEWELAIPALERAIQIAHQIAATEESSPLQEVLQIAKANSTGVPRANANESPDIVNSIGIRLTLIPAGSFLMGSSDAEIRRIQNEWDAPENMLTPETPVHKVEISKPFLMGKYHVTVGQFRLFVNETGYRTVAERQGWGWLYDEGKKHWIKKSGASWKNPGTGAWEDDPITLICHVDAEAFCEWLSQKDHRQWRLPTEAEWEYAARGGLESKRFPWGDEYPDGKKANIADISSPMPWGDKTVDDGYSRWSPGGCYEPNGFRLYDIVGNLWQLCSDYYEPKAYETVRSGAIDPTGPRTGKERIVRGGNWAFGAGIARNAFRYGISPTMCVDVTGFRVVAELNPRDSEPIRAYPDELKNSEHMLRLFEKVKDLVSAGKRAEARKLVEGLFKPNPADSMNPADPGFFVRSLLDAFIDETTDNKLQTFSNSLGMDMIRIPAGSFIMGSSESDISWAMNPLAGEQPVNLENEYPLHKVRLSRPFLISATPVTVGQFRRFVEETGYVTDAENQKGGQAYNMQHLRFERKEGSNWRDPGWIVTDDQPVTMVSCYDAEAFANWLTAREKQPYKLPTEAQWEFAARGGRAIAQFPWGDTFPDGWKANYADSNKEFPWSDRNADCGYKTVAPVGTYQPNGYGLYDMAGNVLHWVRDHYKEDYYSFTPEIDPEGPGQGEYRVMKGGAWTSGPVDLRCAFRGWGRPDLAIYNSGFRVIIDLNNPQRNFYFSNDFLTKEWVPNAEQREVASTIAKGQDRQGFYGVKQNKPEPVARTTDDIPIRGVEILDFTPKSGAKKAGLKSGDVIIEYNGSRELTRDRLAALSGSTKHKKGRQQVIFVRDGIERSALVSPGPLGISGMDKTINGPFRRLDPAQQELLDDNYRKSRPLNWL